MSTSKTALSPSAIGTRHYSATEIKTGAEFNQRTWTFWFVVRLMLQAQHGK